MVREERERERERKRERERLEKLKWERMQKINFGPFIGM